jgi:hypothetical protein
MCGIFSIISKNKELNINEIKECFEKGMSVEELVKQGLGEKYKAWAWNFITEERWIKTLYKGQ